MLFIDYYLDIGPGGISLDNELTLEKLPGFKPGDIFILEQNENGRVFLRKKENLEKLILKSAMESDNVIKGYN